MRRFLISLLAVLLLVQPVAAIRVPSGSTTHKKFFRMVDSTDHVTPETGLSSFTVYRSREGGTNTLWTTPTIAEIDATNSPGLYALTIDEDTTITTANDTEELAISVAHAGCDIEIFIVELYDDTGANLDVPNGKIDTVDNYVDTEVAAILADTDSLDTTKLTAQRASDLDLIDTINSNVGTAGANLTAITTPLATVDSIVDAIVLDTAEVQTSLADGGFTDLLIDAILTDTAEIGAAGAGLTEAGGTGDQLTAVVWNAAWDAEVESEANDALVAIHLDHLLAADYDPASKPGTSTALLNEIVENDGGVSRFTVNALENGPSGSGASAETIADAVWDEVQSGHVTAGTFGLYLDQTVSTAGGGGLTAGAIADAVLDEALSGHTTAGTLGKAVADIETDATAILADTDELQTDDIPGVLTGIKGATWSSSTDTLEAIRDRGDIAWTTGVGTVELPVSQVPVPKSRTANLVKTSNGLYGEFTEYMKVGEAKLWAIDFASDMPLNGSFSSIVSVELATGTSGGITFDTDSDGVDGTLLKILPTGVTAGSYTVKCTVTYSPNGETAIGTVAFTVVE